MIRGEAPGRQDDRQGSLDFERNRGVTHLTVRGSISHVGVPVDDPVEAMVVVFRVLAEAGVNTYLIKIHDDTIAFAVDSPELDRAVSALEGSGFSVGAEPACSIVSTVARSMRDMSGVMSRIIGCLAAAKIEFRELADSYNSVSCLVQQSDEERAIAALQGEFGVELHAATPEDPW